MCWSDILSRYKYDLKYHSGKLADRPDVLLQKEQDMPAKDDERLYFREKQLFDPETLKESIFLVLL